MGAAKKLEMPSDEKWLSDAIREGRAVKMELSMKAIGKPDMSLQQRVADLDLMHVSRLERMLRDGTDVYPIVVFRDPETGKLRIADGFHRWKAYQKAGMASIWAWVIEGTYRDALIYSAMCNQLALLQRKPEDIKKAVFALLSIKEWRGKSPTVIASHVGCSRGTAIRYSTEYEVQNNIELPAMLESPSGILRPRKLQPRRQSRVTERMRPSGSVSYAATVGGQSVYLGTDRAIAEKKLEEILEGAEKSNRSLDPEDLRISFARRWSLHFTATGVGVAYPGIGRSYKGHGVVWVSVENYKQQDDGPRPSLLEVHSRARLARQLADAKARSVVVCEPKDIPQKLIAALRADGVEYLTPDELVASIKGTNP